MRSTRSNRRILLRARKIRTNAERVLCCSFFGLFDPCFSRSVSSVSTSRILAVAAASQASASPPS